MRMCFSRAGLDQRASEKCVCGGGEAGGGGLVVVVRPCARAMVVACA